MAHELSHTIQQQDAPRGQSARLEMGVANGTLEKEAEQVAARVLNGGDQAGQWIAGTNKHLQRQAASPTPASSDPLQSQSVEKIMADEAYIDNHLKSIEFFTAELAILHYDDGSQLRLGLVPQWVKPPIEGVDYRTPASTHIPIVPTQPGKLEYLPRGKATIEQLPDTSPLKFGDLLKEFTRTITFKRDAGSGRIVPTQVNSITAPRLCQVLRESEAEYVKNFDAFAQGGKKVFEKMKVVVEIAMFLPAGGTAEAGLAERGAARGAAAAAAEGAEASLTKKFLELLGKKAAGEITVEGVAFGDIEVMKEGTQLFVRRSFIQNVGRIANQGKLMQGVWESAAVQAAKQVGAKSVEVSLRLVQNPTWAAYLESQGYTWQVLPKLFGQVGLERVLVKVLSI